MPAGQCNDARPVGTKAVSGARRGAEPGSARRERPAGQGKRERMMGFEPTTFCMASRCSSQLSYIRVVIRV